MRKRQYILPCGRVVFVKEFTTVDLAKRKSVRNHLLKRKDVLDSFQSFYQSGRNKQRWVEELLSKFSGVATKVLVDELMQGNRVETFNGHRWVIGRCGPSKHMRWETNGIEYGIKVENMTTRYRIRMAGRRRAELKKRILGGQSFH